MGMIRKAAYNYIKQFKGEFGLVRDVIVVEATWLGGERRDCYRTHFTPI
jgi:hypothetical protein